MKNLPSLPFRRRHGDPADAPQLDELLDAADPTAGDPTPEWQSVSDLLRSAAAAAEPSELAGEAAALAAFRREREGVRRRRLQPIARYQTVLSTLLTRKIAVGLTAGVVTLTGAATAAYACVLPSPIQSLAHDTIGAPAPTTSGITAVNAVPAVQTVQSVHHERDHDADHSATPSATPSISPTVSAAAATKAAGSAATTVLAQRVLVFHLCKEFAADAAAGKALDGDELAALVKAAGSTASITAYCAALPTLPIVCPEIEHGATATPLATASAGSKGDDRFGCDDRGRGHIVDPRVIPLPTINHDGLKSPDADHSVNGDDNSGHDDSGHSDDGSGHH